MQSNEKFAWDRARESSVGIVKEIVSNRDISEDVWNTIILDDQSDNFERIKNVLLYFIDPEGSNSSAKLEQILLITDAPDYIQKVIDELNATMNPAYSDNLFTAAVYTIMYEIQNSIIKTHNFATQVQIDDRNDVITKRTLAKPESRRKSSGEKRCCKERKKSV
ncbi:MAG: hypothetical protein Q9M91_08650 [Candidatus Dojkabacteria bacterium]|nr:hypothetical protein [Candidatus Dojkabacteria bacterium]